LAGTDTIENLAWVRFFAVVIALALIIIIIFAMFSTRKGPYSSQPLEELHGLGEQLNTFQDNVDKSIHRGSGEIL
jgi:hypothetical protein